MTYTISCIIMAKMQQLPNQTTVAMDKVVPRFGLQRLGSITYICLVRDRCTGLNGANCVTFPILPTVAMRLKHV